MNTHCSHMERKKKPQLQFSRRDNSTPYGNQESLHIQKKKNDKNLNLKKHYIEYVHPISKKHKHSTCSHDRKPTKLL